MSNAADGAGGCARSAPAGSWDVPSIATMYGTCVWPEITEVLRSFFVL